MTGTERHRQVDELPLLDVETAAYAADRAGVLATLREAGGIARGPFGVELLTYDACWAVRQGRVATGFGDLPLRAGIPEGALILRHFRTGMGGTEGAEHARLRRAVAPFFTPANVERLRGHARAIVDELLAAHPADAPLDFLAFADGIPARVFLLLVGGPASDADFLARVSTSILKLTERESESAADEIVAAYDELMDYATGLIELRTHHPGDDLVSALLATDLTPDEIMNMLGLLLAGSTDNTAGQMALLLAGLADLPDDWQRFRAAPHTARDLVSEGMRMFPRQVRNGGIVTEAMRWDDVELPAGTFLIANVAAGYRDPAAFADPDRFDAARAQRPALNFGSGPHVCLGAHLARMEIEELFVALAARWERIEVLEHEHGAHHYHDAIDRLVVANPAA